jgi:hypothetical protein
MPASFFYQAAIYFLNLGKGKGVFLCPGLVADIFDVSSEDRGY